MKTTVKDFVKSLNKFSKVFLGVCTPIIISLFLGGIFLQIIMLLNGWSSSVQELSQNLITCAADSFSAVYITVFFIELFSGKYR